MQDPKPIVGRKISPGCSQHIAQHFKRAISNKVGDECGRNGTLRRFQTYLKVLSQLIARPARRILSPEYAPA